MLCPCSSRESKQNRKNQPEFFPTVNGPCPDCRQSRGRDGSSPQTSKPAISPQQRAIASWRKWGCCWEEAVAPRTLSVALWAVHPARCPGLGLSASDHWTPWTALRRPTISLLPGPACRTGRGEGQPPRPWHRRERPAKFSRIAPMNLTEGSWATANARCEWSADPARQSLWRRLGL